MQIIQYASKNYKQGRADHAGKIHKPLAIVNHITAGAFPGCLSWLCNPKSQASAHYIVNRIGAIYQLVSENDTAWHAGVIEKPTWLEIPKHKYPDGSLISPNYYTIGIEHECAEGQTPTLTDKQYAASLWLHKQILARNTQILCDNQHIVRHSSINAGHNCPGPGFPWVQLWKDLGVK